MSADLNLAHKICKKRKEIKLKKFESEDKNFKLKKDLKLKSILFKKVFSTETNYFETLNEKII